MPCNAFRGSILRQFASSSRIKKSRLSIEDSFKQKIIQSNSNELPNWAVSYSFRSAFHISIAARKPKNDNVLHSASLALDEETSGHTHDNDTSLQILLEWKALRSYSQEKSSTPAALSSKFFDSNVLVDLDQAGPSTASKVYSAVKSKDVPLWITTLDHTLLATATHNAMMEIKYGERDVNKLAANFFNLIEENSQPDPRRELCLEEIQIYLLAQWIARADKALMIRGSRSAFVNMCLDISFQLYQSSILSDASLTWIQTPQHANLRMIQQATLHRLFDIAYICSSPKRSTVINPSSKRALMLMSFIIRDPRLRPAQNRHLCRKFLQQMRSFTEIQPAHIDNRHLWSSIIDSSLHMTRRGIISDQVTSSTKEPIIDDLMSLICFARSKRHLSRSQAYDHVMSLAGTWYELTLGRNLVKSNLEVKSVDLEDLIAKVSFIRTTTLEEIVKVLHRSGDRLLLRQIAFMIPQEQRSFTILLSLMRNWSNVLPSSPDFEVKGDSIQKSRSARMLGYRRCSTSEKIWSEVQHHLHSSDRNYESKLQQVFGARMASHARSKMPSLVVADLKFLKDLKNNDDWSREDILSSLPEKGRIDAMRAFLRTGRLIKGARIASEIIKDRHQKEMSNNFKIKVLNVFLSSDLRLRMKSDVMIARRRLAILLRRRAPLIKQKLYLRLAVNRYYRSIKQSIHKMDSTTSSKRLNRFFESLQMLNRFTNRHGITPNDQTNRILLNAVKRLGSRFESKRHIIDELLVSLDWQQTSVAEVTKHIKNILTFERSKVRVDGDIIVKGRRSEPVEF